MPKLTTLSQAQAMLDGSFIPEPMEQSALKVLQEAMEATVWVRGPKLGKDGTREYVEVPDHAIRLTAATRVIEWRRGKPSAQLTIENRMPSGGAGLKSPDLVQAIRENPDLVRRIMDGYINAAKQVVPIDAMPAARAVAGS